jgi:deoxyribodipyrimidine photo-lyase
MKSIFIFRRDFRLTDNLGLIECAKKSSSILPIFIFTPEQIEKNDYFSSNCFEFLLNALDSLDKEFKEKFNSKIHYFYGDNVEILKKIYKEYKYDAIYFNMDYTVYSKKRDLEIKNYSNNDNIQCIMIEDYLLLPINSYLKSDGTPFLVYGPFKKNARKITVPNPNNYKFKNIFDNFSSSLLFDIKKLDKYYNKNKDLLILQKDTNRESVLKILKDIRKFIYYPDERNILIKPTTHLSAYIKYGLVSMREVYHTYLKEFGLEHGLVDQLYWREFYFYIAYYTLRVLEGKSLKEKYDAIVWENDKKNIIAWKKGLTGFPAVDAGMREMNSTGYMHNRARLITSGILIKILKCDWRIGEKYFAQTLIDYDPCVNNGNWQWSSSSGADSQPYFRIMSPWKQAIDHDPQCEYIKKWIPELKDVPPKDILKWDKSFTKYKDLMDYPGPIVDYEKSRKDITEIYKKGIY